MIVTAVVPITFWFVLLQYRAQLYGVVSNPLSILGIAYGTADWILAIIFAFFLFFNKSLHEKYQLKLIPWGRHMGTEFWKTVGEVAKEGGELMVVDLSIQLSLTITIYVAATQHFEFAYKLSAVQAAYWTHGPQYLIGMMLFVKMVGAQLIASKEYYTFLRMFAVTGLVTLGLFISGILAAVSARFPTAYSFGQNACIFATTPECLPIYENIFQGPDSLPNVFIAFGPIVGLQLLFILLRAGLAMCYDFKFMAITSVVTFIIVYVPMIIAISVIPNPYTTTLYYIAMYSPHFVLIIVFGTRLIMNLIKLYRDEEGPWTFAQRTENEEEPQNEEDEEEPQNTEAEPQNEEEPENTELHNVEED